MSTREEVRFEMYLARLEAQRQAEMDRIEKMLQAKTEIKAMRSFMLAER